MAARNLLIVDDDPFIRKLVATTLEGVSGFDLHEAADGVEAVAAAAACDPEIVLLDVDMPRMNGIEACRAIRASERGRDVTIVILTASTGDVEAEARAAGASIFLTKPFSPLDLLRLVDEIGSGTA